MICARILSQVERFAPHTWPARITAWRERARGLDFSRPESLETLGLDPARSVKYSAIDDRHLRRLLDGLDVKRTDRILDYGCGKGRALRAMLKYPFERVDGVELSESLADTARRNFARLHVPRERCRIFSADAGAFTDIDDYTHFYLYDPFPSVVVRVVVANIHASAERRRRDITVVYHNAKWADDFLGDGRFVLVHETADKEKNRSVVMKSNRYGLA